MFDTLTNRKLIAAYEKALELQLEKDFINLLKIEMESRGLLEKE
ncbi:sporulation histidine kinase inhibitor Sda [Aquibacillus kalidii]|nr:sporulation histidine kinase inhibitor Sda [Aquibacillus kalidii]